MQYSTRTMLWGAAVAAVLLTCLVYPEPFVGDLFYTAGVLLFSFGIIAAIYFRGRRRAFLIGFLVLFGMYTSQSLWLGGSQIMLRFAQIAQPNMNSRFATQGLITTRLLSYAYEALQPDFLTGRNVTPGRAPNRVSPQDMYGRYMTFMVVGHTLFGLALGVLGGWIAQRLAVPAPPVTGRPLEKIIDEMNL